MQEELGYFQDNAQITLSWKLMDYHHNPGNCISKINSTRRHCLKSFITRPRKLLQVGWVDCNSTAIYNTLGTDQEFKLQSALSIMNSKLLHACAVGLWSRCIYIKFYLMIPSVSREIFVQNRSRS